MINRCLTCQGTALTAGASLFDYSVDIGDERCEMSDLLENRLFCRPPSDEPGVVRDGAFKDGQPRIVVSRDTLF